MERQLVLTRLVLGWSGALVRAAADLPDEELVVPASPADAARLAATLARLIDQVGATPEAWAGLTAGMPADLARYWEITLEFLKIATESGRTTSPRGVCSIRARGATCSFAPRRARLAERGAAGPVIAAGSTGSVPATATFSRPLRACRTAPSCCRAWTRASIAPSWAAVGPSEREPAGAGHPQFGLKKLLEQLGLPREEVQRLGNVPAELAERNHFVSESMRPASTTERWSERLPLWAVSTAPAVAGFGHRRSRERARRGSRDRSSPAGDRRISGTGRRARHAGSRSGAPRGGRADALGHRRRRFGGPSLAVTPPGVLARLVAEAALGGGDAATLLALLKHPLAAFGMPPAIARRAARSLERAILRGPRLEGGLPASRTCPRACRCRTLARR